MSSLATFRRRLDEANRATQLPPESRYNLAASTIDDDVLEQTVETFGGPPAGQTGFGMTDIVNEFLSRDPKYFPVQSITQMQTSLRDMGYADESVPIDGGWSPYWAGSARRAERDAFDLVRSGKHVGATPVKRFFEYLSYTIPSEVFNGVYGVAKGIVEQAADVAANPVETAEEAGALGGAAVGAIAGGTIGSVVPVIGTAVGAGAGAVIGGVGGFFADLFDEDEGEEEHSGTREIWDALTPYDEWKADGAQHFFNALSTVMTASSLLKAGSIAVQGTRGVLSSTVPGGTRTVSQAGFREAFRRAAPGTVEPGIAAKIASAAVRRPVIGGAITGATLDGAPELLQGDFAGAFSQAVRGAAIGAIGGKVLPGKVRTAALAGLQKAPIQRIVEAPAGQILKSVYTGASVVGITGRLGSELPGEQAIEREIEGAPDLGVVGDVLDWTVGLALYPERLLPIKPREVGQAIAAMHSNNALYPFARAALSYVDETGQRLSRSMGEAFAHVKEQMGRHPVTGEFDEATLATRVKFAYLNQGLNERAREAARAERFTTKDPVMRRFMEQSSFERKRSEMVGQMFDEADAADVSPLAREVLDSAVSNPLRMQAEIEDWEGGGSLIEHFTAHQQASEFLQKRAAEITKDGKRVAFVPAVKGTYLTSQDVKGLAEEYRTAATEYAQARKAVLDAPPGSSVEEQVARSGERLDNVLLTMQKRELIEPTDYISLRPGIDKPGADPATGKGIGPDPKILKRLDKVAELRPNEIPEMTRELADNGLDRYIAVATDENMLFYEDIPRRLEISGAARRPVRDVIAGFYRKADDQDLGRLRYHSIAAHLDPLAERIGLADGQAFADRIYDSLKARYDPDIARAHGYDLSVGRGGRVRRTKRDTGEEVKEWFKIDPRDLTPKDLVEGLNLDKLVREGDDPYEFANDIKRALHVGAAYGADAAHPIKTARALAHSIGASGLPGFSDFMSTARLPVDRWAPEMFGGKFKKGSYGWIPRNARRAHMAIQFSMSPMFDASRIWEAISFGAAKGKMPPDLVLRPRKTIEEGQWKSPFSGQDVRGADAVKEMYAFADEVLYGRKAMQGFDELQFRLLNAGMLGFKPREVEAAQAWWLAQKKMRSGKGITQADYDEIAETVMEINRYGKGQTAMAKSVHFIFFPYLFQAKQVRMMHDFVLGAPTRNLLVHEGLRRWYGVNGDPGLSESFSNAMEKHLPIVKELERLNNLSYGIGAGRFFLEGVMDKSTQGKVTQGLASFFIPGGISQPIANTAGGVTDAFKHLFTPVVLFDRGERVSPADEMLGLMEGLVPVYRDAQRWFEQEGMVQAQAAAIAEGASPTAQYQEYSDFKRVMTVELENLAKGLGFSSYDSLRSSDISEPLRAQVEDIENTLGTVYPSGKAMADRFVNSDSVKQQAVFDMANKDDQTDAERAAVFIAQMEEQAKDMAEQTGMTQDDVLKAVAPVIRQFALAHVDDRQFNGIWDALYAFDYGPIRRIAA